MATMELDELAQLMPRIRAANERADVNLEKLRDYMATAQDPISHRTSVAIRTDVRKDAEGFEDIDDFWADDDGADDKDDTEGEDSSILSEGILSSSSANVSMMSDLDVSFHGGSDGGDDAAHSETMELESQTSQRGWGGRRGEEVRKKPSAPLSVPHQEKPTEATTPPKKSKSKDATMSTLDRREITRDHHRSAPSTPERRPKSAPSAGAPAEAPGSPDFGGDDGDMSWGQTSTPSSSGKKKKAFQPPPRTLRTPPPNKKQENEKDQEKENKAKTTTLPGSKSKKKSVRRESRDSFGGDDIGGFDENNVNSPFSIHDAVLTPLSNASEKNLRSIEPFSENGSATDSPNIRVALFKPTSKKSADAWDGDNITKRAKKKPTKNTTETTTKKKNAPPLATPTMTKKTRKYKYKSTPTSSEISFGDEQTDNDDGSFLDKSGAGHGTASEDDDSDDGFNKSLNVSRSRNGREGNLSYADDVLMDADANDEGFDGLRRSKRKRFKPLEWYKGEHYVYERRQSGVGLVIPTMLTIERVGTRTPQKKRPTQTVKAASRSKSQKPFPRDQLPKEFTYEEGEWADLWDTSAASINKMNVICRSEEIELRDLPSVDGLVPGYAGQSFNLRNAAPSSRWISGRLGLPPGAAKEAESVGDAVQVFFVMGGQPQSLEVALGPAQDGYFDPKNATRFVLNPNDEFYIPAKNAYYLRNHSEKSTCELHFMILKPDSNKSSSVRSATSSAENTPVAKSEPEELTSPTESERRERKRPRQ